MHVAETDGDLFWIFVLAPLYISLVRRLSVFVGQAESTLLLGFGVVEMEFNRC